MQKLSISLYLFDAIYLPKAISVVSAVANAMSLIYISLHLVPMSCLAFEIVGFYLFSKSCTFTLFLIEKTPSTRSIRKYLLPTGSIESLRLLMRGIELMKEFLTSVHTNNHTAVISCHSVFSLLEYNNLQASLAQ